MGKLRIWIFPISKGNNSNDIKLKLRFLFSTNPHMLINKPMNFHDDILNGCLVVTEHKRQECKVNYFPKGHNSKNMQRKLIFFVFCMSFYVGQ